MMLRRILALVVSLASPAALAASDFLRPGQWEMTMQVEREGKRVTDHATSTRCITAATLEKDRQMTFQPFESGCTGTHQQSGKDITWTYQCAGPPPMRGSGKLSFTRDKYWGESESYADFSGGKSLRMIRTQTRFKARRTGDCSSSLPAPEKKAPIGPSRPADPNETRAVVDELRDRIAYVGEREVR